MLSCSHSTIPRACRELTVGRWKKSSLKIPWLVGPLKLCEKTSSLEICLVDCPLHIVCHFRFQDWKFQPYSLRRGGATHLFRQTGNMHRTLLTGRWKHLATAKLYIQAARAALNELLLPSPVQLAIRQAANRSRQALRCQLGTHGRS